MKKKIKYCQLCKVWDTKPIEAVVTRMWGIDLCQNCTISVIAFKLRKLLDTYEEIIKSKDLEIKKLKRKLL